MAKILLIDDDPSIRNVFQRFLERNGYTLVVASDGQEGLSLLRGFSPDLIITDVMMPQKDGLEVALELRTTHPTIPIFAISGGMRSVVMDFLPMIKKFGAKRVFYKPIDLDELLVAIKEQLGEDAARPE